MRLSNAMRPLCGLKLDIAAVKDDDYYNDNKNNNNDITFRIVAESVVDLALINPQLSTSITEQKLRCFHMNI
jgi:hypothetical protein